MSSASGDLDIKICARCMKVIFNSKEQFRCGICHRRTHVECADGNYTSAEVKKLTSGNTTFFYVCHYCKPKLAANKDNTKNFDAEESKKKSIHAHAAETQKLRHWILLKNKKQSIG